MKNVRRYFTDIFMPSINVHVMYIMYIYCIAWKQRKDGKTMHLMEQLGKVHGNCTVVCFCLCSCWGIGLTDIQLLSDEHNCNFPAWFRLRFTLALYNQWTGNLLFSLHFKFSLARTKEIFEVFLNYTKLATLPTKAFSEFSISLSVWILNTFVKSSSCGAWKWPTYLLTSTSLVRQDIRVDHKRFWVPFPLEAIFCWFFLLFPL